MGGDRDMVRRLQRPAAHIQIMSHDPQLKRLLRARLSLAGYQTFGPSAQLSPNIWPEVTILDASTLANNELQEPTHGATGSSFILLLDKLGRSAPYPHLPAATEILVQPFTTAELYDCVRRARIKRIEAQGLHVIYRFGSLVVNTLDYIVTRDGRVLDLTPTQLTLLLRLVSSAGEIVSFGDLLRSISRSDTPLNRRTLGTFMFQLGKCLRPSNGFAKPLSCIRGVGYRLIAERAEDLGA
jgi:DNA-binding winged helix-turn-helix (wHTH) protein